MSKHWSPKPEDGSCPTPSPTLSPSLPPTGSPVQETAPKTLDPTVSPTKAPITASPTYKPTDAPVADPTCDCGNKSNQLTGEGKVTGGGWIYFDSGAYLNTDFCGTNTKCVNMDITTTKANYGFNAMYRKGIPMGSTNFGFDGSYFHFHSETRGQPLVYLEVVDEIHARWFGRGSISTKLKPKKNDWSDDFCFMVAVQDHGEPGATDTWRIRIWRCADYDSSAEGSSYSNGYPATCSATDILDYGTSSSHNFIQCATDPKRLVFDTDVNEFSPELGFPRPSNENYESLARFHGTEVGELTQNGGGNIQIHLPNKRSKALDYLLETSGCPCASTPYEGDCAGFVTGGGWITLDSVESAYLKDSCNCQEDPTGIMDENGCTCNFLDKASEPIKANYGFNVKAFNGKGPTGSTNFNVHGLAKDFHFHTDNADIEFDGFEPVCSNSSYGYGAEIMARWTGIGKVQWTEPDSPTTTAGWEDGFRFFVAVQDYGEPSVSDTFRIRIMDKHTDTVLLDTDYSKGYIFKIDPFCGSTWDDCTGDPDFDGNPVSGSFETNGGGNIQMHCKGGPDKEIGQCAPIIPVPPLVPRYTLLYSDDFEDGTSDDWSLSKAGVETASGMGTVIKLEEKGSAVKTISAAQMGTNTHVKVLYDYCASSGADSFKVEYRASTGAFAQFHQQVSDVHFGGSLSSCTTAEGSFSFESPPGSDVSIKFDSASGRNEYIFIEKIEIYVGKF